MNKKMKYIIIHNNLNNGIDYNKKQYIKVYTVWNGIEKKNSDENKYKTL